MVLSNRLGWIGVDIGTHTVKLAQAMRTPDGLRLRHAAVIQRPSSWSDEDDLGLNEPDQSSVEICAALECGEFRGRNAACLLPMNVCELRGLNVPQGDDRERRAMIANELADDWIDRSAAMEFDFWELGGDKRSGSLDGFNVNVLSRGTALDRAGRPRLPTSTLGLLGRRRRAAGDGPRSRDGDEAAQRRARAGDRLGLLEYDAVRRGQQSAALRAANSRMQFPQVLGIDSSHAGRVIGPCATSGRCTWRRCARCRRRSPAANATFKRPSPSR